MTILSIGWKSSFLKKETSSTKEEKTLMHKSNSTRSRKTLLSLTTAALLAASLPSAGLAAEVPAAGAAQTPAAGAAQTPAPATTTPQVPATGAAQPPATTTPQAPTTGAPQSPAAEVTQPPTNPAPQTPAADASQPPTDTAPAADQPQAPASNSAQPPATGTPQKPAVPATSPTTKPTDSKTPPAASAKDPFYDIVRDPNRDAIMILYNEGIIQPAKDRKFRPNDEIGRSEFSVILGRAMDAKGSVFDVYFKDPIQDWAIRYIGGLSAAGIYDGYLEGVTFGPKEKVTRAEAAAMVARAAHLEAQPLPEDLGGVENVPVWAQEDVGAAYAAGLIKATDTGTLNPNKKVTRSEMAAMMAPLVEGKAFVKPVQPVDEDDTLSPPATNE
ncbi:hypothetical protein B9G55_17620 [Saccharibacillus sp. O16]|nr:hypothetical protein B9G55_17620 [Saccharibacillus sp. O16]